MPSPEKLTTALDNFGSFSALMQDLGPEGIYVDVQGHDKNDDVVGNVTYNSVWLDGVEASIGMTVPSAQTLGWPVGTLLTNLQVDGPATTAASVVYVDNLTITRW